MAGRTKLEEWYSTKQLLTIITGRYGLNQLGIKQLLKIDGKRFNKLRNNVESFNVNEYNILITAFPELEGRFTYV